MLRFIFWSGLFLIEASLVAVFWVFPQFQTQVFDAHHALQLEIEEVMREHVGLRIVAVALLGLFIVANVCLTIKIWRAFRKLQANE